MSILTLTAPPKARFDECTYTFNLTQVVGEEGGDQISSILSTKIKAGKLGEESKAPAHNGTHVTVWVSEGTPGQQIEVTCKVITVSGRTISRKMIIPVENV